MEHKIEKVIPEKITTVVDYTTCDICKRKDNECEMDEIDIEFNEIEYNFPECGKGVRYSYDICKNCFKNKLMPLLSELGAEPTSAPWDY